VKFPVEGIQRWKQKGETGISGIFVLGVKLNVEKQCDKVLTVKKSEIFTIG
jgi:hypothetical protein